MLIVCTAHWHTTPWAWVETPIRPCTAADGAAARSRARPRTASAGMPLTCSASSGVNALDGLAHGVDAVDVGGAGGRRRRPAARARPPAARRVGPRPHEVVLVGDLGRLGAARVDDHQPPSASGELAPPLGEVGHRPERAVRRHRVVADEHEQVGVVDVGHGQEELVPVERPRHHVVRQLVDRGGGEPVPGAQQPHQGRVVGQCPEAVHVRVALVDRHRVVAVLALHGRNLDAA